MDKAALPPAESLESQLRMDGCDYWREDLGFSEFPSSLLEDAAQFLPSADNVNCNLYHSEKITAKGSDSNKIDDVAMKKLSHNAKERQRRKKLNALYAKLHCLIPHSSVNMKKQINNPAIVCGALNYISQLREEVDALSRQRDELLSLRSISEQDLKAVSGVHTSQILLNEIEFSRFPSAIFTDVSISAAGPALLVTVQTAHAAPLLLSTVLLLFEEEKLEVMNASTFVGNEKSWHSIQVKPVVSGWSLDTSTLRLKILSLCEQSRVILLQDARTIRVQSEW